jgi:hypothetical protein
MLHLAASSSSWAKYRDAAGTCRSRGKALSAAPAGSTVGSNEL